MIPVLFAMDVTPELLEDKGHDAQWLDNRELHPHTMQTWSQKCMSIYAILPCLDDNTSAPCQGSRDADLACCCGMQNPLTLLLLGPTARGVPGLLGVAALSLQIEGIKSTFSSTCCELAQPIALISPAGKEIGCINAAARLVCCQPAAASASPASQMSCVQAGFKGPADTAINAAASEAAQPADQREPASPVVLTRNVSAAVQTDTLGPQHAANTQPLQIQDSCTQADTATSTMEVLHSLQLQQSQPPCVIQSPHFHIYPPATEAGPTAPAQEQPVQVPPVFNISQPTFVFAPPLMQRAPTALPRSDFAEGHTMSAPAVAQQRLQHAQPADAQIPTSLMVPQAAAGAEVAPAAEAQEDFESWCSVSAVPHMSSTAAAGSDNDPAIRSEASGAPVAGQYCSGAHALKLRPPKQICHHQVVYCKCSSNADVECYRHPAQR